ncbi:MAG: aldo/keto reductase [Bifidobacteriaceae bacterium]|jgi:aryl-alcohol dehydrogenase-like predicted oxidoreductase|nr:aldo/keto reductase [Bifidobacteriaceae bacterium]
MKTRRIGPFTVSAIGLGAMPMSIEGRPSRDQAIATVRAALEAGVNLIDTADAYHQPGEPPGHNELLVAEALALAGTKGVLVATKGGHYRPDSGQWLVDGRPEHLAQAARDSAKRLGVEAIDLYQFHRPDPRVTFADSVGAFQRLLEDGVIRYAGLSNVDNDQIAVAKGILGDKLVSVQNQYSPSAARDAAAIPYCGELGLAYIPYRPLGGLSAAYRDGGDYSRFAQVGARHGVSPQAACLAWLLAHGPNVVPIPGSSRPATIIDSATAGDVALTAEDLDILAGDGDE